MRKSSIFLLFLFLNSLVLSFLLLVHPAITGDVFKETSARRKQLVRELGLTDLCLFTEARYTRHLTQADLYAAFQDHPIAFEHFPSGSLVTPRLP